MKKKFFSLVLAICLLIPCILLLSSCDNLWRLHINLNGGHYTQAYKDAKGLDGETVTKVVNPSLFDNYSIPTRADLIAPDGKVFAGWYLNKECSIDNYFNKSNWNRVVEEKKASGSKNITIYPYWIDASDVALTFDLSGSGAQFTQAYKNEINIDHNISRLVGTSAELMNMIPEEDDIIVPEDRYFEYWALDQYGTTKLNEENLELFMQTNADIRVYPIWDMITCYKVGFSSYVNLSDETNTDFYSFEFDDEMFNAYGNGYNRQLLNKDFWEHEFAEVQSFLVGLEDHIELSIHAEKYEFAGWKIVDWNDGVRNLIEINQVNWDNQPAYNNVAHVSIVATWNKLSD